MTESSIRGPTLYVWVFDQHTEGISDGGAGGFCSCQEEVQHCGDQVVMVELSRGILLFLREQSVKRAIKCTTVSSAF